VGKVFKYTRVLQFNFEDEEGFGVDKIRGRDIVELAEKIGANTIAFFARDAWGRAFYNSRIMRKIEKLGKRDLLKELVEEASKRGIAVIPMVGHTTNPELYSKHPEWAQRRPDGSLITMDTDPAKAPRNKPTWPLLCLNSPFLDFVKNEAGEVLDYGVQGVFLDSFRYMPDEDRACFCSYCKEAFLKEKGDALSVTRDRNSRKYKEIFEWRLMVNVKAIAKLSEYVKKRGKILVYNNHPLGWRGRANSIAELAKEHVDVFFAECSETDYQPPGFIAEMVKLTRALTGKPVWASRNSFHMALTSSQTTEIAIRQGLREAFAGGGWPLFLVFASTFLSGLDLEPVKQVFEEVKVLEEYMQDAKPLPYVAVVFSNRSRDWSDLPSSHITDSYRGFYYALMSNGYPVNYVSDTCLDEGGFKEYKAVVLANVQSISKRAVNRLKEFSDRGGGLIATYVTGIMDEHGKRLEDTLLSEVLDLSFRGFLKSEWSYLKLASGHPILRGLEDKIVLWGDFDREFTERRTPPQLGWHVIVESNARRLASIILPDRDFGNEYENGRSPPPPVLNVETPGILTGKGWVYFSGQPGRLYWRNGMPLVERLILNAVEWIAGPPPVKVVSDGFVELEVYIREGQILLHLLNHTYIGRVIARGNTAINDSWASTVENVHPPSRIVPLSNVKIVLRGYDVSSVYLPLQDSKLQFRVKNGIVEIELPRLEEYAFLVVNLR